MTYKENAAGAANIGGGTRQQAADAVCYPHHTMESAARQSPGKAIYAAGRVVGFVRAGCFFKDVLASRHMLHVLKGWAFDVASLDDAERAGAHTIVLQEQESGRLYVAGMALVRAKGLPVNRGFGRQWALPLEYWTVSDQYDGAPVQLTLFGAQP